uniref:Uncharacterized protein n=1 Tax=Caenorhabditis japonica TaxID=281687 RepID=A0A8R1IKS1_CAEJA
MEVSYPTSVSSGLSSAIFLLSRLEEDTPTLLLLVIAFALHAYGARWKKSMEKETSSEFFLRTSQKVSFAVRTILYKCVFSNSRGHPKGKRCEQCPAFIKCCERNHGQFEVVACFGHLGHEHPTETSIAREIRLEKYRQIDTMEAHNIQHRPLMSTHKRHVYVDEYGRPTEGVMIVMEEGSEDVTVDNQDEYSNVIVEEGEPELLEGQKTSGRQVYIEQPGPSHYQ